MEGAWDEPILRKIIGIDDLQLENRRPRRRSTCLLSCYIGRSSQSIVSQNATLDDACKTSRRLLRESWKASQRSVHRNASLVGLSHHRWCQKHRLHLVLRFAARPASKALRGGSIVLVCGHLLVWVLVAGDIRPEGVGRRRTKR